MGTLPPVIDCGTFFECLEFFFLEILQVITVLAVVLATIFIAWAGILYITQGGSSEKNRAIHKKIVWAMVGLVVSLVSYGVVSLLEYWISTWKVFSVKFVLANVDQNDYQALQVPQIPQSISCGQIELKSVFEQTELDQNIWEICSLYYLSKFLSLFYNLALMLGIIFLTWSGILYITKPEKSKEIHDKLKWGIIGVIIAILSLTIVNIIENFFLNLNP